MESRKVALVTGASAGIGRATTALLAREGYRVFGSLRSESVDLPAGVERTILDVRDDASVQAAVAGILELAGRIDVLVNNAGATVMGSVEETSDALARDLFDINVFGSARTARAVLPSMRERRSGRIVFVSSALGFLPAPYMGWYSASKHAVEALGETLDHEVRGFGVRSLLVEPGYVSTGIGRKAPAAAALQAYASRRTRVEATLLKHIAGGDAPERIAERILEAVEDRHPRSRYAAGRGITTLSLLRRAAPSRIFDPIFRLGYGAV